MSGESQANRDCECKVGRVANRRNLAITDAELERAWVDGEESLRSLADRFNVAVLGSAADAVGMTPLDGEMENFYRLLTDDDVTSGTRTQTRNRLGREGIDVDGLESDFVSHQTVYNHLRNCLGVVRDDDDVDQVESARGRVRSLQSRMEAVTTDAVERVDGDRSYDVYVELAVVCRNCGRRHEFGPLVERGGCECESENGP